MIRRDAIKRISEACRIFYRENRPFCHVLLAWLLLFFLLRTLQHFSFGTNACDLSLYDYAISSTLKGGVLAEPFHGYGWGSLLAIHFTPILFCLVPFYLFLHGPLFLLYIQVLGVGLAAVPLYLIAREKLQGRRSALIVALSYLLFRPLLNGLMYDFHPEMFLPLFIFSGHYCLTKKKNKLWFGVFMLMALFIKEDFAIYVFFYCLWLTCSAEWRRTGLRMALLSAIYGALAFTCFIPHFRDQIHASAAYEFMSQWRDYGDSMKQIVGQALLHPQRLLHDLNLLPNLASLANYFLPLLMIPVFDPLVLLVLPPLFIGWLSRIPLMASFGLYYGAPLIAFLFLALPHALARLHHPKGRSAARHGAGPAWILNLLLILSLASFKWNLFFPAKYRHIRNYPEVRDGLESVPAQASLAVQSSILPHARKRHSIAMLPEIKDSEYILLHLDLNPWPLSSEQLRELADRLQRSPEYRLLSGTASLRLYRRASH